jgi:hypothetical protein
MKRGAEHASQLSAPDLTAFTGSSMSLSSGSIGVWRDGCALPQRGRSISSGSVAPIYFFAASDLNEIPRRNAAFFMASGDRPVILATCSNDVEARASSISRRSSLNDQRDLRTIMNLLFRTNPPSGVCSPGGFAGVGRTFWGNCPVSQPIVEPLNFATNAGH